MRHCFDLIFLWMSDRNGTDNNTYLLFVVKAERLQKISENQYCLLLILLTICFEIFTGDYTLYNRNHLEKYAIMKFSVTSKRA